MSYKKFVIVKVEKQNKPGVAEMRHFFIWGRQMEEKTIYCPKCNVKAYEYDGRATTTIYAKCKSCHKIVCYCPSSDETYLKNKPYRSTSSGIRFY